MIKDTLDALWLALCMSFGWVCYLANDIDRRAFLEENGWFVA